MHIAYRICLGIMRIVRVCVPDYTAAMYFYAISSNLQPTITFRPQETDRIVYFDFRLTLLYALWLSLLAIGN